MCQKPSDCITNVEKYYSLTRTEDEMSAALNSSRTSEGSEAGLLRNCSDVAVPVDKGDEAPVSRCNPCGWSRWTQVGAVVAVALLLSAVVTVVVLLPPSRGAASYTSQELPGIWITPDNNLTLSGKLRIIPRRDWLAQPARERDFVKKPVPLVVISHSASEGCKTQAECTLRVRLLQTFHIESRGWSDIAYNFIVGGDGFVYEGRGWGVMGAHTYGYNNVSVGINMIGTFIDELPPERQLTAAKQLIALGVANGEIAKDYKLFGHRQLSPTESPGAKLFEEIKTWPHWAESP